MDSRWHTWVSSSLFTFAVTLCGWSSWDRLLGAKSPSLLHGQVGIWTHVSWILSKQANHQLKSLWAHGGFCREISTVTAKWNKLLPKLGTDGKLQKMRSTVWACRHQNMCHEKPCALQQEVNRDDKSGMWYVYIPCGCLVFPYSCKYAVICFSFFFG